MLGCAKGAALKDCGWGRREEEKDVVGQCGYAICVY